MREWLAELRGGRAQSKVAKEIGIAQSTYASIETGYRTPSVDTAKKNCRCAWVPMDKVFRI